MNRQTIKQRLLRVGAHAALCAVCLLLLLNTAHAQAVADAVKPRKEPIAASRRAVLDIKAFFSEQEQRTAIPGLGNPVAQLLIFRELKLSERQRFQLATLAREASPVLLNLREKRAKQERALEDAIYGESFDAKLVEQMAEEAAATQRELVKTQLQVEFRLGRILNRDERRQMRFYRALFEQIVNSPRNRALPPLLVARQNLNGQWRLIADFFGDDWELAIPGFGNPASYVLVLRQLNLTAEQKTALRTLAQEVSRQLLAERAAREQQVRESREQIREALSEQAWERPEGSGPSLLEKRAVEMGEMQSRLIKRQAYIETRIRQTLNQSQWNDYVALWRGLATTPLNRPGAAALPGNLLKNGQRPLPLPVAPKP